MPLAHPVGSRLRRTSAVVEATTDRNTPPNNAPDASSSGSQCVSAGSTIATPSKPFSSASASPPAARSSSPAQMRDDAITATPSSA